METRGGAALECQIMKLDTILKPEVLCRTDLVKIDVEGFEMEVLLGMEEALKHMRHATIVVEITPRWLEENGASAFGLYEFLTSRGWRARGGIRDEMQWDEIFVPPLPR